jgi:Zn finger protein HypA/HybF involved in hydrogenase expression
MHEQAIAREIIVTAENTARNQGKKVLGVTVEVGDLAHLPGEEMKEALQALVPKWKITIVAKKALVSCVCGFEGEPLILEHGHGHVVYRCPECHSMMPDILEGDKIAVVGVDVS